MYLQTKKQKSIVINSMQEHVALDDFIDTQKVSEEGAHVDGSN